MLELVDLEKTIDRKTYKQAFPGLELRLGKCQRKARDAGVPIVIAIEGWDAAGKGSVINRLTQAMDARGFTVRPINAATEEERLRPWMWRYWRQLPREGNIAVFDRSWYGRVLVERVEGLCTEDAWRRAYREINEFERQLADFGTVIVKFWLHIDRAEQLRRFKAREQAPHKQWKITDEDWRNRRKWPHYTVAAVDMLKKTSTTYAPWTVLEANNKLYARIKALQTVADALEAAVG